MTSTKELTFLLDKITTENNATILSGRQDSEDILFDGRYCRTLLSLKALKKAKTVLKNIFELKDTEHLSSLGTTLKVQGYWHCNIKKHNGKSYKDWTFYALDINVLFKTEMPIEIKSFRDKVVSIVWEAVEIADCHKSSEGAMSISMGNKIYVWNNVFTEDPRVKIETAKKKRSNVKIELFAYVLGPTRHHEWTDESLEKSIEKANKDLDKWIEEERNCPPIDSDW